MSDANGFFQVNKKTDDNNPRNTTYKLDISYNNDRLFIDEYSYNYYYRDVTNEKTPDQTTVYLFTDRSIYRPGQVVYYKGLAVITNSLEKKGKANSEYENKLYLRNANYELIDSVLVKSNEYGSFSGKFQLPGGGLNGVFYIHTKDDKSRINFRMEEYKRPKFYVDYEKNKRHL